MEKFERRWKILLGVFQDMPGTIKENKLPIILYSFGLILLGFFQVAMDNFSLDSGDEWYMFIALPLFAIGLVLLVAGIYEWIKPMSFWSLIAWLIAIQVITWVVGFGFNLLLTPITLVMGVLGDDIGLVLTPFIVVVIAVGGLFRMAVVAYLTAYLIITASFALHTSKRVLKIVLVMTTAVSIVTLAIVLISELLLPNAPLISSSIDVVLSAIFMMLLLVAAVTAFRKYDPELGRAKTGVLPTVGDDALKVAEGESDPLDCDKVPTSDDEASQ